MELRSSGPIGGKTVFTEISPTEPTAKEMAVATAIAKVWENVATHPSCVFDYLDEARAAIKAIEAFP